MRNVGVAIGLVLGAAAGLLLAPASGPETRARLRRAAHDATELAVQPGRLATKLRDRGEAWPLRHLGPCAPTL